MRKLLITVLPLFVTAALNSCAPKVTTEMFTNEYSPLPTDSVRVIDVTMQKPPLIKVIGEVEVRDHHMADKKADNRALVKAIEETAKNGGNVLIVKRLLSKSKGHKQNYVKGQIAHTRLSATDPRFLEAVSKPAVVKIDTAALSSIDEPSGSLTEAVHEPDTDYRPKQGLLGVVKLNVGPIWTVSRIYTGPYQEYVTDIKGWGFDIDATYYGGKYYGFGVDISGNRTEVPMPYNWRSSEAYELFYIGPHIGLDKGLLNDRLHLSYTAGLGLSYYTERGQNEVGLGVRSQLGIDYRFSQHIGIGIELSGQTTYFKRPEWFKNEDEIYGLKHLGLMVGVRLYL